MKPLDIDGNELRVGDDVELVERPNASSNNSDIPKELQKGFRSIITDFRESKFMPGWSAFLVGIYGSVYSRDLRLIPRDKKADKNISWKSEVTT